MFNEYEYEQETYQICIVCQDDGWIVLAEPCDIIKTCGRTDFHGHSGFERGLPGGDGDFIDWYIPATPENQAAWAEGRRRNDTFVTYDGRPRRELDDDGHAVILAEDGMGYWPDPDCICGACKGRCRDCSLPYESCECTADTWAERGKCPLCHLLVGECECMAQYDEGMRLHASLAPPRVVVGDDDDLPF